MSDPVAREAADRQQCMYEITWQANTPLMPPARPGSGGRTLQQLMAARMVLLGPDGLLQKELKTHLRRPTRSVAQATARLCDQQATALQRKLPDAQPGATVCLVTRGSVADAAAAPAGLTGRGVALLAASMSLSAMHRVAAAENPGQRWAKLGADAASASAAVQTVNRGTPDPELRARAAAAGGHGVALTANIWTSPKLVARPQAGTKPGASAQQPETVLVTGDACVWHGPLPSRLSRYLSVVLFSKFAMCPCQTHCNTIAGGTGSVGSLVALWLAEHAGSHIILLGRSGRHPPDSRLAAYRCAAAMFVAVLRMSTLS